MTNRHELLIWSVVVLGLLFYVGTFMVAWNATADYRESISGYQASHSATN